MAEDPKKTPIKNVTRVSVSSVEELRKLAGGGVPALKHMAGSKEELLKKIQPIPIVGDQQTQAPPKPMPINTAPPKAFSPRHAIETKFRSDVERIKEQHKLSKAPVVPGQAGSGDRLVSQYQHPGTRLKREVLSARPADAPSILEECRAPVKLAISQHQSPGDIVMLTAAIRDLHKAYPGQFETNMQTPAQELWQNNPHIANFAPSRPEVMWIEANYPLINNSNQGAHHFIHGFHQELESKLGLTIPVTEFKGDVHLTDDEKRWASQVFEMTGRNIPFWIIDAGCKRDFTTKQWEIERYQQVVDTLPEVTFVQIGHSKDLHKELKGDNLISLIGKTDLRQLMRLMYHAAGVITPISLPMHLAAAIETHPRFRRKHRPCIVIAGGREPAVWEAYTHHQYLHTCGMLPCCSEGGCWSSRVVPLLDGDSKDVVKPCLRPIESTSGQIVPKCMDMITVDAVVEKVRMYLEQYTYLDENEANWYANDPDPLPKEVVDKRVKAQQKTKTNVINRNKK